MPKWLMPVARIGLIAAKVAFPQVHAIEAAVKDLKGTTGPAKLDAAETAALAALDLVEDLVDRDLLDQQEVREAYRRLISAYADFMSALSAAKRSAGTDAPLPPAA